MFTGHSIDKIQDLQKYHQLPNLYNLIGIERWRIDQRGQTNSKKHNHSAWQKHFFENLPHLITDEEKIIRVNNKNPPSKNDINKYKFLGFESVV